MSAPDRRFLLRGRNLQTSVGTFQQTPRRINFHSLKKYDYTRFSSPLRANSLTYHLQRAIKNNAIALAREYLSSFHLILLLPKLL